MFHKILVPMDRSAISQQVFDEALSLAKATGASLFLLHVLSAEEEGSPDTVMPSPSLISYSQDLYEELLTNYQKRWKAFEEEGLELLRSHTSQATAAGVSAEFTQLRASPSREICNLADTWQADLILMGRRGRSGLSELFLGSVSNYVFHHAPCSVLTVQSPASKKIQSLQTEQAELPT
ncbi:MAG TPA: universal stress protein [Cyanobacteria bacterium UBA8543]|nr:universal stress protein [Cyanobacteria bacterium UBA8543]